MRAIATRGSALSLGVVLLASAGCGGDTPPPDRPSDGVVDAGDPEDDPGDDAEDEAATPSGRILLSGFRDDHPGGVSLEVTSLEVDASGHLLVGVEAVHAAVRSGLDLGEFTNVLEDDLGNTYEFQRPADNARLNVPKDHRLVGTLAFLGPVDPQARRVTLALNQVRETERVGAGEDGRLNRTPRFLVEDVPLPGVGLEDEASDPEALRLLETRTVEVGDSQASEDNPDVTVTVVSYETDGRTTTLDIDAVNRSGVAVGILVDRPSLRDDQGRRLQFLRVDSEEQDERQLRLEPGEEGSATMAFRGAPTEQSGELRLVLNSLSAGEGRERTPGFRFVLPVPASAD